MTDKISNNIMILNIKFKKKRSRIPSTSFKYQTLSIYFFPFKALSIPAIAFFAISLVGSIVKILFQ